MGNLGVDSQSETRGKFRSLKSGKHILEEHPWEVIFLSEVVCEMENCEPLGEEQLKQDLLR